MTSDASGETPDSEMAILRTVLNAETSAAERIAAARREAMEIVHRGQAAARRVEMRADRRIQRLHGAVHDTIDSAVAAMAEEFDRERSDWTASHGRADTVGASRRLAVALIGLEDP